MKPMLTAPGSERLKLNCKYQLSIFACNLRRYIVVSKESFRAHMVRRCRSTLSNCR